MTAAHHTLTSNDDAVRQQVERLLAADELRAHVRTALTPGEVRTQIDRLLDKGELQTRIFRLIADNDIQAQLADIVDEELELTAYTLADHELQRQTEAHVASVVHEIVDSYVQDEVLSRLQDRRRD